MAAPPSPRALADVPGEVPGPCGCCIKLSASNTELLFPKCVSVCHVPTPVSTRLSPPNRLSVDFLMESPL